MLIRSLIGKSVRQRRLMNKMTLRDVSKKTGISLGYLSEIELAKKDASSEILRSLCEGLGVELIELLKDSINLQTTEIPIVKEPLVKDQDFRVSIMDKILEVNSRRS